MLTGKTLYLVPRCAIHSGMVLESESNDAQTIDCGLVFRIRENITGGRKQSLLLNRHRAICA